MSSVLSLSRSSLESVGMSPLVWACAQQQRTHSKTQRLVEILKKAVVRQLVLFSRHIKGRAKIQTIRLMSCLHETNCFRWTDTTVHFQTNHLHEMTFKCLTPEAKTQANDLIG